MKKLAIGIYYGIVIFAALAGIFRWLDLGPAYIKTKLASFLNFPIPLYSGILVTLSLAFIAFFLGKGSFYSKLIIHTAYFGKGLQTVDVTDKLRNQIKDNTLDMVADIITLSDPCKGAKKQLVVTYAFGNQVETVVIKEGDKLHLPAK